MAHTSWAPAALCLLLAAASVSAQFPPKNLSPPSPPPSMEDPLLNRNVVLFNTGSSWFSPHVRVELKLGFTLYTRFNTTSNETMTMFMEDTREALAVVFAVAHIPGNSPDAPIYIREVSEVPTPSETGWPEALCTMFTFDADAGPQYVFDPTVAQVTAGNPLIYWEDNGCNVTASPCLSRSFMTNLPYYRAYFPNNCEGPDPFSPEADQNTCLWGGRINSLPPSPPPSPPPLPPWPPGMAPPDAPPSPPMLPSPPPASPPPPFTTPASPPPMAPPPSPPASPDSPTAPPSPPGAPMSPPPAVASPPPPPSPPPPSPPPVYGRM